MDTSSGITSGDTVAEESAGTVGTVAVGQRECRHGVVAAGQRGHGVAAIIRDTGNFLDLEKVDGVDDEKAGQWV